MMWRSVLLAALFVVGMGKRLQKTGMFKLAEDSGDWDCINAGGKCQTSSCRDSAGQGYTKSKLCNGADNRVCCFKGSDRPCAKAGGTCQVTSSSCSGGRFEGNMCAGTSKRKCCLPWAAVPPSNFSSGSSSSSGSSGSSQRFSHDRVPADKVAGYDGYNRFTLRSDLSADYNALYKAVHQRGGSITSAGSLRSLNAKVSYGRSSTSLHYTGAAFDMSIYAGGYKPDRDPMVLVEDSSLGDRRWRVYFRSDCGSKCAVPVEKKTLNAVKFRKSGGGIKRSTQQVTGYFFDFTALAWANGFTGIPCWKSTWAGKGGYAGLEFWHFQCKSCIKRGQTFGSVLKKMYSESKIIQTWGRARWDKSKVKKFGRYGFR